MTEEERFNRFAHSLWVVTEAMWELDKVETLTDTILDDLRNTAIELVTWMYSIDEDKARAVVSEMNEEFAPNKEARVQRAVESGLLEIEEFLSEVDDTE